MVKKTDEDWSTCSMNLSTSTNVRKYLDLCKDWLVTHDSVGTEALFYNIDPHISEITKRSIGMYENETRHIQQFYCSCCNNLSNLKEDGKSFVANPFTRAQFMLVCNDCFAKLSK